MIEPYRVVEDSPMGFSFEKYADSEEEAFQILGRLIQERATKNQECRARVEICINHHHYRPISEHAKLPAPADKLQDVPIGVCSILPGFIEKAEWICSQRFAAQKLRSIGATKDLFLTEFRVGMMQLALKTKGDFQSAIPLLSIDTSTEMSSAGLLHMSEFDSRLQKLGAIRQGLVVSASIRNDGPTPARVALFLSGVPLPERPDEV